MKPKVYFIRDGEKILGVHLYKDGAHHMAMDWAATGKEDINIHAAYYELVKELDNDV